MLPAVISVFLHSKNYSTLSVPHVFTKMGIACGFEQHKTFTRAVSSTMKRRFISSCLLSSSFNLWTCDLPCSCSCSPHHQSAKMKTMKPAHPSSLHWFFGLWQFRSLLHSLSPTPVPARYGSLGAELCASPSKQDVIAQGL